jgi:tetrahydromethanopterin S-methyltransferase subunit H
MMAKTEQIDAADRGMLDESARENRLKVQSDYAVPTDAPNLVQQSLQTREGASKQKESFHDRIGTGLGID